MTRVIKEDAEEGKARIAWRSRDETAEYQPAVAIEVLHPRAGPTRVRASPARPNPIRFVNICENRAEATDRCWPRASIGRPGTKNKASVMLLPTGVNRRIGLKALKVAP